MYGHFLSCLLLTKTPPVANKYCTVHVCLQGKEKFYVGTEQKKEGNQL